MAIEKISIEIKSNASQIKKELADIDARLKRLSTYKSKITIDTAKLLAAKKEISSADEAMKKLQNRKIALQVSGKPADEAKAKLEELQDSIQALSKSKANLRVEVKELENASTVLDKLNDEMDALSKKRAYVQVKKDDAENTESALEKLKLKLTQLGSSKTNINLSSNISSIGSQLDNVGSKLLSFLNPLKSQLSQWIGIGAAVNAVNSAVNLVTGSVSGAVSRFDQINNYPTILQNLGVNAEDAAGSIDRISESIQGLPTTLDSATKAVQGFVSPLGGDLTKAESLFEAANNASMVFAQGSESALDSFVLQYRQALSKGRIYAQEFNIMAEAMPGLMDQIAKMMGYSTAELKEGLGEGEISVDAFNDALVELNVNGSGSFKALSESAKDSVSGIATGVTNMKTAVTRGVTNVISSLDDMLQRADLGGFAGVFASIGSTFETGLTRVGEIITENEAVITGFIDKIRSFDWAGMWSGFKESITELKEGANSLIDAMQPVIDFVKERITELGGGNFAEGLGKLPVLLLKVAVAAKVVGKVFKVLGKVSNFKLPSIFGGKSSSGSTGLSFNFDAGQMLNQVKNMAMIFAAIKIIEEVAQAIKDINDKVPSDLSALAPKLINMGIVIAGMGTLVAVAGKLAEKNTTAAIAGLAVIAGISVDLMLAAEAIKQIDEKVPSGIADFATKMANMAIAIAGMGAIVAAVGALVASGIGALVAGAGLATVALLAADMMLVAEAISELDTKVPANISGVKTKIDNIAEAIGYFTSANLGSVVDLFKNFVGTLNVSVVTSGIKKMNKLADALESFKDSDAIEPKKVTKKIERIQKVMKAFTDSDLGDIGTMFKNFVSGLNIGVVTGAIKKMNKLPAVLDEMVEVDSEDIAEKIESVEAAFQAFTTSDLGDVSTMFENFVSGLNISVVKNAIKKINKLPEVLEDMVLVDVADYKTKLKRIANVFALFQEADFGGIVTAFSTWFDGLNISAVKDAIERINELSEVIDKMELIDVKEFKTKLKRITNVFALFQKADFGGIFTWIGDVFSETNLKNLNDTLSLLNDIPSKIETLKSVEGTEEGGALEKKIGTLKDAFEIITNAGFGDLIGKLKNLFTGGNLDDALGTLTKLNLMSAKIKTLQETEIDTELVGTVIKNLTTVIKQLDESKFATDDMITKETLTSVNDSIGELMIIINSINALGTIDVEAILTTIKNVRSVLKKVNKLPEVIDSSVLESLTASITNLTTALKEMEGLFTDVGTSYGEQIVAGFESADIATKIVAVITDLIKELNKEEMKKKFTTVGERYGRRLRKGFKTEVETMHEAINDQLTKLKDYNTSFSTIGTDFATALVNSFSTAFSNLSTLISKQVSSIQTNLNSLTAPNITVNTGSSSSTVRLSTGGEVPQYLAKGGVGGAFKKKGTDTVPAMLTPGEFVQSKKAVSTFGLDFMKRVNNLDIKGAFNSLVGRFNTYTTATPIMSSVVNNADNRVNNARVTQNITSNNQNYNMRRTSRYLQSL